MSDRGALDLGPGVVVIGGSPRGWRLTAERDSHGDGHVHIERQLWDDNRGEWRENDCILDVTVEQQRALAVFFAAQAHVGMCAVCRSPLQGGPDSGVPYPPIVKGRRAHVRCMTKSDIDEAAKEIQDRDRAALADDAEPQSVLADRVRRLEQRVRELEDKTAPDPRIGRYCRVINDVDGRAPFLAKVVHVDWDGMLLVRHDSWGPGWAAMRVPPDGVEWLDAEPTEAER